MTLTPRFALPRMIEQGKAQTLSFAVYDGLTRVTPTLGVYTLFDTGGLQVFTALVTNLGSNDVALVAGDTSALSRGEAWQERWELTIAGVVETYYREAALVGRAIAATITDDDLERVHPGLSAYLPSTQTSWEPQRVEAFDQLQARLLGKGNRPNLIIGSWALRNVHLYWSLFLVASVLRVEQSGRWGQLASDWGARVEAEWDALSFQYDDDDDGIPDGDDSAVPTLLLTDLPEQGGDWSF